MTQQTNIVCISYLVFMDTCVHVEHLCLCVFWEWVCISMHWTFDGGSVCVQCTGPPAVLPYEANGLQWDDGAPGVLPFLEGAQWKSVSFLTRFAGQIEGSEFGTKWIRSRGLLEIIWDTSLHLAFFLSFSPLLGKKVFPRKKKVAVYCRTAGPDCSEHLGKSLNRSIFSSFSSFFCWGLNSQKVKTNNIGSCLTFNTEHQGPSLLSTVRLSVSSGSEKPATHHSIMSTFLPVLVWVPPFWNFLSDWDLRIFCLSALPWFLLITLQFASCLLDLVTFFFNVSCFYKAQACDLFPSSLFINIINKYCACIIGSDTCRSL